MTTLTDDAGIPPIVLAVQRIAFQRLGLIETGFGTTTPEKVIPYLVELANVGLRARNPWAVTDHAADDWHALRRMIEQLRGAAPMAPLFDGFPEQLPNFDDARLRWTAACVRLLSLPDALNRVEGGEPIPFTENEWRDAMDFSAWGWWPASSIPQDPDLARLAKMNQALLTNDSRTEWIDVTFVNPAELVHRLRGWTEDLAYSAASIRDEVRADLDVVLDVLGSAHIDFERVRFREIRSLFIARLWADASDAARETFIEIAPTPDDILRLFASLTETDTSLAGPVTFPKLSRPERTLILSALNASPRLRDVWRRRDLWIKVAKSLHVGEYRVKFPRAYATFTELRANRRDVLSLRSRVERFLAADEFVAAIATLVDEGPTLLLRDLRRLAELAGEDKSRRRIMDRATLDAAAQAPLRTLLTVQKVLDDNGVTYPRLAITKRGAALAIGSGAGRIGNTYKERLRFTLSHAIRSRVEMMDSWKGEWVWMDPRLTGILVPDQLRSTTDGLLVLDRGSRLPLDPANVLRLFVYWREPSADGKYDHWNARSDLDLSCSQLDADFQHVGHVSWTNLASGGIKHSGDLTSAPEGAAEFIDIPIGPKLAGKGNVRYLAPAIFRYAGPNFADLPEATAGWMLRDDATSDRVTFDIKTVHHAFRLNGKQGTAMPFVYDIGRHEILYLDAYFSSGYGARTETNVATAQTIAQTASTRHNLRPSVAELAGVHVTARGALVSNNRGDATITFGLDDECTYNALRPEKILAELL